MTHGANGFTPETDGLYAVFTTSAGEFTTELYYDHAPLTVANFVRLAEGRQIYFDTDTGELFEEPFYDGLTFHRVVKNFVIQAGSRDGSGTDGPGYRFEDEFSDELRHDSEGILSMANGGVNTNGSQFFITLRATPELDDKHSVFGAVVDGMDVVHLIGEESRDPREEDPIPAFTIESVEVLRIGEAAENWDDTAPPLPEVYAETFSVSFPGNGAPVLHFQRPAQTVAYLFSSSDLISWRRLGAWEREEEANDDFDLSWSAGGYPAGETLYLRRVDIQY
jgi:cyclophilin family peptidyl-prolyl cis-trans isomerase